MCAQIHLFYCDCHFPGLINFYIGTEIIDIYLPPVEGDRGMRICHGMNMQQVSLVPTNHWHKTHTSIHLFSGEYGLRSLPSPLPHKTRQDNTYRYSKGNLWAELIWSRQDSKSECWSVHNQQGKSRGTVSMGLPVDPAAQYQKYVTINE